MLWIYNRGVSHTSHVSHAGNRNDPLCPSDAVLHHLRGKNKGPEGGELPTGTPVSPTLHMCHMLGTEMIHFVHQMQYYITFEVRTRGLRGVSSLRVPRCSQHFTCVTCWEQRWSTFSIRCSSISPSRSEQGAPRGVLSMGFFFFQA